MSEVGMWEKESPLKYLYVRWRQKKTGHQNKHARDEGMEEEGRDFKRKEKSVN